MVDSCRRPSNVLSHSSQLAQVKVQRGCDVGHRRVAAGGVEKRGGGRGDGSVQLSCLLVQLGLEITGVGQDGGIAGLKFSLVGPQ